jgi:competence protein ComEA
MGRLSALFLVLGLTLRLLIPDNTPIPEKIVQVAGVEGWYGADSLVELARKTGHLVPVRQSGAVLDGGKITLEAGWAIPGFATESPGVRALGGKVSLNRATQAQLEGLPGIGPTLAQRIREGRPYRNIAELDNIKGIGPKKLQALTPLVEL